ncbi:unnamed protein product [Lactuca virosa]|uniref:Uncharacterized protein n=1 Tax=Lactuca virosa TaxID=75947 RepID=A0AAU9LJB2_9ASTR|nr:unnamed protein product [Lactuca virosa]
MILCTLIKWYQTSLMLAAKHGKTANVEKLIEVAITVNMKLFIVIIIFFMRKVYGFSSTRQWILIYKNLRGKRFEGLALIFVVFKWVVGVENRKQLTLHPIIISGGIDCTLNDKTVLLKSAYLCYPTLYFQWISLWPTINRLGYERLT